METSDNKEPLKVLGLLMGPTVDSIIEGEMHGLGAIEEILNLPETQAQVKAVKISNIKDLSTLLNSWKPNIIYVSGGITPHAHQQPGHGLDTWNLNSLNLISTTEGETNLTSLLSNLKPNLVYLDAQGCESFATHLFTCNIPNIICWPTRNPPPALSSMNFARCFFSALRNPYITVPEAFSISTHLTMAYCSRVHNTNSSIIIAPNFPKLLSSSSPELPGNSNDALFTSSSQIPSLLQPGNSITQQFPSYSLFRLCSLPAELRFLVTGVGTLLNFHSSSHLCHALRGLISAEVRSLTLAKIAAPSTTMENNLLAHPLRHCTVVTASGVELSVVITAPVDILDNPTLVELGLRQTMVVEAQSLQLKVPSAGVQLPRPRRLPSVCYNAPLMEVLAVTSVWIVELLKKMSQAPSGRLLVSAGIYAISTSPVTSFSKADANRFTAVAALNAASTVAAAAATTTTARGGDAGQVPGRSAGGIYKEQKNNPSTVNAASSTNANNTPTFITANKITTPVPASIAAAPLSSNGTNGQMKPVLRHARMAPTPRLPSMITIKSKPVPPVPPVPVPVPVPVPAPIAAMPLPQNAVDQPPPSSRPTGQWISSRPALHECTEELFKKDLSAFLESRNETFREITLNGSPLDIFGLYKQVCAHGGYFKSNTIDWMEDVYKKMKNANVKKGMHAGVVANTLKNHYSMLLLDYEKGNLRDLTSSS